MVRAFQPAIEFRARRTELSESVSSSRFSSRERGCLPGAPGGKAQPPASEGQFCAPDWGGICRNSKDDCSQRLWNFLGAERCFVCPQSDQRHDQCERNNLYRHVGWNSSLQFNFTTLPEWHLCSAGARPWDARHSAIPNASRAVDHRGRSQSLSRQLQSAVEPKRREADSRRIPLIGGLCGLEG